MKDYITQIAHDLGMRRLPHKRTNVYIKREFVRILKIDKREVRMELFEWADGLSREDAVIRVEGVYTGHEGCEWVIDDPRTFDTDAFRKSVLERLIKMSVNFQESSFECLMTTAEFNKLWEHAK